MRRAKLSPARGWRGRSLALLRDLPPGARAPLIHRQGGMNIYKKLRNSSLTYSFSFSPVPPLPFYSRAYLPLTNSLRDSSSLPYIYISLSLASRFLRFPRFLDTVRSFSGHYEIARLFIAGAKRASTIAGFITKTRNCVIMYM